MSNILERLRDLLIVDIMSKDVVTIREGQTLAQAAATFRQYSISSAPVTDAKGRCIGVLSAIDFLKASDTGQSLLDVQVEQLMTSGVKSISPTTSILRAAVVMSSEHLHRLPVINSQNQLVGVISTMDIVSAMINAVEEASGPIS